MRRASLIILLLVLASSAFAARQTKPAVHGRVLDADGKPVAGVDVDYFWSANGSIRDKDGKVLASENNEAAWTEHWSHVGKMAPMSEAAFQGKQRSDTEGWFSIAERDGESFSLIAMNSERTQGALFQLPHDYAGGEIVLRLSPLIRLRGVFASPDPKRKLGWSYADLFAQDDPKRPLGFTRIVGCGTNDGRFELFLPPGRYRLRANNSAEDWELRLVPSREITLTSDKPEVDLGVMTLTENPGIRFAERKAKAAGRLGDYKQHYGKAPPAWHVDEARGVKKDVKISDFKGKWVLLDFWGLSCTPCLRDVMPELMKFYEEHAADRERFEILSICIDTGDEIASLEDLDRQLAPVVEHVWHGKKPQFPILLDKTNETWLNFGIPGLGFVLLIDPEGHVVEGDLKTLAEKLKR